METLGGTPFFPTSGREVVTQVYSAEQLRRLELLILFFPDSTFEIFKDIRHAVAYGTAQSALHRDL